MWAYVYFHILLDVETENLRGLFPAVVRRFLLCSGAYRELHLTGLKNQLQHNSFHVNPVFSNPVFPLSFIFLFVLLLLMVQYRSWILLCTRHSNSVCQTFPQAPICHLSSRSPLESPIFPSLLTSRHDVPHILYSQGWIFIFSVDPDDTMTQAAHREDGSSREGGTRDSRSTQERVLIKHGHLSLSHLSICRGPSAHPPHNTSTSNLLVTSCNYENQPGVKLCVDIFLCLLLFMIVF